MEPHVRFGFPFAAQVCVAGKYTDSKGQTVCKPCKAGGYSSEAGGSSPTVWQPCPAGRWSGALGLNSSEGCVACEEGKYQPQAGSNSSAACKPCATCGANMYQQGECTAASDDSSCHVCDNLICPFNQARVGNCSGRGACSKGRCYCDPYPKPLPLPLTLTLTL